MKKLNNLLDIAIEHENNACYQEAVKAHKRSVLLIQHLVNNHISSKTVQNKLISVAINSIKQTEILENILIHLKNAKSLQVTSDTSRVSNKNVNKLLEEYFLSPEGQRHTDEQKVCIENISKIVNISKSKTTLKDVAGMEGIVIIYIVFINLWQKRNTFTALFSTLRNHILIKSSVQYV